MKKTLMFVLVFAALILGAVSICQAQAQAFPLRGSFVNFERNLSDAEWALELDKMHAVGMNDVPILSAGVFSGSASGTTCGSGDISYLWYSSATLGNYSDKISMLVSLAQARGMKVWVGSLQPSDPNLPWDSTHLRACNKVVAQETAARFGVTLDGYYWSMETWLNSTYWYGQYSVAIPALAGFVADVAQVAPGKKLFAAPYFKKDAVNGIPGMTAVQTGQALSQFLSGSGLKLVAPQDGIGAQAGAPQLSEIGSYYAAMQSAAQSNGAELWSTVETFVNNGGNQNMYPPAPVSRVSAQVAAEQPYVTGIVSWMFGRDMSVQATYHPIEGSALYAAYSCYYLPSPGACAQKVPFTYSYSSNGSVNGPSPQYPDPAFTKLTDGSGGGYPYNAADWVGFADTQDGNVARVSVNLGQYRNVRKVRMLVASEQNSWILFPQVTIADGTTIANGILYKVFGCVNFGIPDTSEYSIGWVEMTVDNGSLFSSGPVSQLTIEFHHVGWVFVGEVEVYQ